MASRASALALAVALLAALVPSAVSQSLPVLEPGSDHSLVAVDVPFTGTTGSGSVQVPVDGGILDIHVSPILLPGPGGTVDVEAYLATVRMLLPSGVVLPLPSMVIRAEDRAIDGPAAQALADLAASVADLQAELQAMADELTAPQAEPEPEPEPEGPDPMAEQLAALQAQAEGLAAEAAWVQAFADEAAGAAGAGVAEQAAIANAMLARVEAGLALVQKGLDAFQAQASALADEAGVPAPPEMPSGSESETPASDPEPSGSSMPMPTPPTPPDPSPEVEAAAEAALAHVADAQAAADEAQANAEAARDALVPFAGAIAEKWSGRADALAQEQLAMALDGASKAVALAEQAVADRQAGAETTVAELRGALQALADERSQSASDEADAAALAAQEALDAAIGRLQWASDWVAEARAMGSGASEGTLADAQASIDAALRSVAAAADIVDRYVVSRSPVSPPAPAEALAEQLAGAGSALDGALAQAETAHEQLEASIDDLPPQDADNGLEAIPPVPGAPDLGAIPGLPEVPTLPSMPGMPVSFDAGTMAVCVDSLASQACFHYRSPIEASPGSLRVLIALPAGTNALDDAAGSLPGDLPIDVPDPDEPLPTTVPSLPVPLPGGSPGLPESSQSSTDAPSEDPEDEESSTSSSSSLPLLPGSTTSQSTAASSASPHLQGGADMDALGLRLGEQRAVVMTVRNDGTASDTVSLTAQTDAPIAFDTTEEAITLAPGQEHDFVVRITPLSAGSGKLDLLATGTQAGSVVDTVLVAVEAAPAADAANIAASLDPTAMQSAVGQATAVTLRVANQGKSADVVSVVVSGPGMQAEPSEMEIPLQAGETAARQVWITPIEEGASQVLLKITSDKGADLKPIVLMDALGAIEPPDDDDGSPSEDEDAGSKDSPSLGLLVTAAAVGVALLVRRKLRKT